MKNFKELTDSELEQVSGGLTNPVNYYGCNTGDFIPKMDTYTGNPICSLCEHYKNSTCEKDHDNPVYGLHSGGGL